MREPHLVPLEGRKFFYALVQGDFPAYIYSMNQNADSATKEEGFSDKHRIYLRLALASVDLGLAADSTGRLLSESAFAAKLSVDMDPTMLPMYAIEALFSFQAVVAEEPTKAFARALAARPLPTKGREAAAPHVHALVAALAHSILGDTKKVESTLAALAKLGPLPSRGKSGPAWFESMREVARACLLGAPSSLAKPLSLLADRTTAYFGADFEDQNFESCFGTMALAFVARARDRGFDVSGPDPHTSMPFELLRLPRRPLPDHPWQKWPPPDKKLTERIVEAFRLEMTPVATSPQKTKATKAAKPVTKSRPKAPAKVSKTAKKKLH